MATQPKRNLWLSVTLSVLLCHIYLSGLRDLSYNTERHFPHPLQNRNVATQILRDNRCGWVMEISVGHIDLDVCLVPTYFFPFSQVKISMTMYGATKPTRTPHQSPQEGHFLRCRLILEHPARLSCLSCPICPSCPNWEAGQRETKIKTKLRGSSSELNLARPQRGAELKPLRS